MKTKFQFKLFSTKTGISSRDRTTFVTRSDSQSAPQFGGHAELLSMSAKLWSALFRVKKIVRRDFLELKKFQKSSSCHWIRYLVSNIFNIILNFFDHIIFHFVHFQKIFVFHHYHFFVEFLSTNFNFDFFLFHQWFDCWRSWNQDFEHKVKPEQIQTIWKVDDFLVLRFLVEDFNGTLRCHGFNV